MIRQLIFPALACSLFSCGPSKALLQKQQVQLSPPIVDAPVFFSDSAYVHAHLGMEGVQIQMLTNQQSPIDRKTVLVDNDFELQVIATHPDFMPSDTIQIRGFRMDSTLEYDVLQMRPAANEQYSGEGPQSLNDQVKGSLDFKSGQWLGFYGEEVQLDLALKKDRTNIAITLSFLVDQSSWIFAPTSIQIYGSTDGLTYELLNDKHLQTSDSSEKGFYFETINTKLLNSRFLKIELKALKQLPDWHPGAGHSAWLFIDEIILKP